MKLRFQKKSSLAVAVAVALQLAWITVIPAWSYDGLVVKGGSAIGKSVANGLLRFRHCADIDRWTGLYKIPNIPGVAFSSSALRFDRKQDLSLWPVLSNGLERSPPFLRVL